MALFYLLTAMVVGTILLHLTTLPIFRGMQQSVVLFILGMVHAAAFESTHITNGVMGQSYLMWMNIDPHLLLFAMLPALVTGDAITIDTSLARKVAKQCMYLAGPGFVIGVVGIAFFLKEYFHWPLLLCLCTGSILSTTDPVAVVSLLKDLGASPTLTMQIQGEALLKDGTAVVLYLLTYNSLMGQPYGAGDVTIFLIKMAFVAIVLGVAIGYLFYLWIRLACKKLEHRSGLIQTTLTICCAYSSFCIAEGWIGISGVLCTVASSLVLADKMWPYIVEKEALHQIWRMLEFLGNTIVFFLAGGLTGRIVVKTALKSYFNLWVLYLVVTLVRGLLIFLSRPLLKCLSTDKQDVSLQDAAIMTWGGLRGAVGLALAVQVNVGRIEGNISEVQADEVLFYTAGLAFLTLLINATTSPILVRLLGVARTPVAKHTMLMGIHSQLERLEKSIENPSTVHDAMAEILERVKHHVVQTNRQTIASVQEAWGLEVRMPNTSRYLVVLRKAKASMLKIPKSTIMLLQVPPRRAWEYDQTIERLTILHDEMDRSIAIAMNEALLLLVRSEYWKMINSSKVFCRPADAEVLLDSVRLALDSTRKGIEDLKHLTSKITLAPDEVGGTEHWPSAPSVISTSSPPTEPIMDRMIKACSAFTAPAQEGCLVKVVGSRSFSVSMFLVIVANCIHILIQYMHEARVDHEQSFAGAVFELIFVSIFTLEFILKFLALRCRYFLDSWNLFDFLLVVIGLFGICYASTLWRGEENTNQADMSQEARSIRMNRICRALSITRFLRVMRYVRSWWAKLMHKKYSPELAERLQSITVLHAFITAHVAAQDKLVEYFGNDCQVDTPEVAQSLCQSQAQVYRAIALAGVEIRMVDPRLIRSLNIYRKVYTATWRLQDFILKAHSDKVITTTMTETILHPIRDQLRGIDNHLQLVACGIHGKLGDDELEGGDSTITAEESVGSAEGSSDGAQAEDAHLVWGESEEQDEQRMAELLMAVEAMKGNLPLKGRQHWKMSVEASASNSSWGQKVGGPAEHKV